MTQYHHKHPAGEASIRCFWQVCVLETPDQLKATPFGQCWSINYISAVVFFHQPLDTGISSRLIELAFCLIHRDGLRQILEDEWPCRGRSLSFFDSL